MITWTQAGNHAYAATVKAGIAKSVYLLNSVPGFYKGTQGAGDEASYSVGIVDCKPFTDVTDYGAAIVSDIAINNENQSLFGKPSFVHDGDVKYLSTGSLDYAPYSLIVSTAAGGLGTADNSRPPPVNQIDNSNGTSVTFPEDSSLTLTGYNYYLTFGNGGYLIKLPKNVSFKLPDSDSFKVPLNASFKLPNGDTFNVPDSDSFNVPDKTSFTLPDSASFSLPSGTSFNMPNGDSFKLPSDASLTAPGGNSLSIQRPPVKPNNGQPNSPPAYLPAGVGFTNGQTVIIPNTPSPYTKHTPQGY